MIDNEETYKRFGYYADDLKPKSGKRIVAVCNNCSKIRELYKFSYCDLCNSCAQKIAQNTSKGKEFHKQCNLGRKATPEMKRKQSESMKQNWVDHPERHKEYSNRMSNNNPSKFIDRTGNKNGRWQGGLSFGKYCYKFNNQLKQSVRDCYNNCDYMSGLPQKYFNRKLDVHHVDYDKSQGCNGKKFNLIPLSQNNHTRTNSKRSFWNRLFNYSLEYDKEYYTDNKIDVWEMIK